MRKKKVSILRRLEKVGETMLESTRDAFFLFVRVGNYHQSISNTTKKMAMTLRYATSAVRFITGGIYFLYIYIVSH